MFGTIIASLGSFNFPHFIIGFIFLVCAIAIIIILVKWLAGLMGLAIPQPLMVVGGILLFMLLLWLLLNWAGFSV